MSIRIRTRISINYEVNCEVSFHNTTTLNVQKVSGVVGGEGILQSMKIFMISNFTFNDKTSSSCSE